MNMVSKSCSWEKAKLALTSLEDLLRCWLCNKVADNPQNFSNCGHFFCFGCVNPTETTCPMCGVPSKACEVSSDRLVNSLTVGFKTVSALVNPVSEAGQKEDDNVSTETGIVNVKPLGPESTGQADFKGHEISGKGSLKDPMNTAMKQTSKRKTSKMKSGPYKVDSPSLKDETKVNVPASKTTIVKRPSKSAISMDVREKQVTKCEGKFTTPRNKSIAGRKRSASASKDLSQCHPEASSKSSRTPSRKSTPGKDLSKRNLKGETPLHVACLKGDVTQVRSLLEAGANPNTKDNAGWTPLHEAVNHGFTEVVQLLLKSGVLVDVPGIGNMTPLHEAVVNHRVSIVRLLVAHGADVDARTSAGKTAKDFAMTTEMQEALSNTERISVTMTCPLPENIPTSGDSLVLCAAPGFDSEMKSKLGELSTLGARLATSFGPEVTHLIVPVDEMKTCPPSFEVLSAILHGIWILDSDWISIAMESGDFCDPSLFEVAGVKDYQHSQAPKLGRLNALRQYPRLLNGCHIFLHSNVHYKIGPCELSKSQIALLVKSGDGVILKREPDPEAIPEEERVVPYHAVPQSPLMNTSHFIIYQAGKGEPKLKYNMTHIKTLPVKWLIDSILNWRLMEP